MSPVFPSMDPWSSAWHDADESRLAACYAEDGVVLHPKKPVVVGRAAIRAFLRGGMGKLDVRFAPEERIMDATLACERGSFHDCQRETGDVVTSGTYLVTWVWREGTWQIYSHAWNAIG